MGTPGYLAPEDIEGRPSSEASDVHAWGATVGYAATGRPPFGTGSYETIFYRIVNGRADLAGAPAALVPLLAAALARDPAYRPPAIQLRAQAAVLDPGALAEAQARTGTTGTAAGLNAAGATRSDVAPARGQATVRPGPATAQPGFAAAGAMAAGGMAAGVPPVADLPAAAANGAPNGAGAAGVTALPGFGPPVPAAPASFDPAMTADGNAAAAAVFSPATRPLTTARPLPDDLGDVLTPVRYARNGTKRRGSNGATAPGAAAPPAPLAADREEAAARSRWQSVLVFATILVVAGISVVLPILGTLAALAFFASLRTAALVQRQSTARRLARGAKAATDPLVTAVSLPWFLIRALIALVLLAPLALAAAAVAAGIAVTTAPGAWPDRALAYAAGALVLFYGFGPGSALPRSQLRRVFGTVARTRPAQVVVLAGMTALTAAAISAAVTWPSVYWPTVIPHGFVQFGWTHFGLLRRFGHHLGMAHHIGTVRGFLLRHLAQLRHAA